MDQADPTPVPVPPQSVPAAEPAVTSNPTAPLVSSPTGDTNSHYIQVLTDLIQKQMVMLGPNVALGQARKVQGLVVGDDGTVTALQGDSQQILTSVAKQYMALSGQIAQMTLESIIAKYPDVKLGS